MMVQQDTLGPRYTARTLDLRDGSVATLVHRAAENNTHGAVLYVHGFADYFFQTHLAEFFTDRGWDFYALDLRRYGRSLREGDVRWFVTNLNEYSEELDLAVERIQADGHRRILAMGHSTGGLILPLWLDTRSESMVDGLILNSPWLDLPRNWLMRTVGTWVVDKLGARWPLAVLPERLSDAYPKSLHQQYHGEWSFNTDWKPVAPVEIRAGWMRAIRRGHTRLHRGLALRMPILLMHSDKSRVDVKEWSPEVMSIDSVLDVRQMDRWAPQLGSNVTTAVIPDGLHDLFLSTKTARERAFAEMEMWLEHTFETG